MAAITILLPTFNRRKYLPLALDSIQKQTFEDWRCLVINDGGEDVSDIVASFDDPRIEYHAIEHRGKAGALNHGLGLVASEYIAYMDDDDTWFPKHLLELYTFARKNGHEFVYSDTLVIKTDADGNELEKFIENRKTVTWDELQYQNYINHKQVLHTKALADKAGQYDEDLTILIDYDYIRRLARITDPGHLVMVTGVHYLRLSSEEETFTSITGRWTTDPEGCGRSILRIFSKSPEAMPLIYMNALANAELKAENDKLKKLLVQQQQLLDHYRQSPSSFPKDKERRTQ